MSQMNAKHCANLLLAHEDILILTHRNPDGDTVASAAALCSALQRSGKSAWLFPNPEIGKKLLPWCRCYFAPEDFSPGFIVAVDAADRKLLSRGFEGEVDLCIDHHPTNTRYAAETFVQDDKASCAEIILELIHKLKGDLTPGEASLLYIGLSTDTGCFQYSNTDASAFRAAAELLHAGADNTLVNTVFFRKASPARLRLESMIYRDMQLFRDGRIAVVIVTQKMLKDAGTTEDDLDDLAGLAGRCEGSVVNITIREKEDGSCRVSVRTTAEVSSSEICAVFGGGGHAMAAGCTISGNAEKVRDMLLRVVDEVWK